MSETVMTKGVFWKLKNPLSKSSRWEICEILYDLKSDLHINYEGTLLYSSKTDEDYYGIFFDIGAAPSATIPEIPEQLKNILEVDNDYQPLFFLSIWHNGTDSPQDQVDLEEFLIYAKRS